MLTLNVNAHGKKASQLASRSIIICANNISSAWLPNVWCLYSFSVLSAPVSVNVKKCFVVQEYKIESK